MAKNHIFDKQKGINLKKATPVLKKKYQKNKYAATDWQQKTGKKNQNHSLHYVNSILPIRALTHWYILCIDMWRCYPGDNPLLNEFVHIEPGLIATGCDRKLFFYENKKMCRLHILTLLHQHKGNLTKKKLKKFSIDLITHIAQHVTNWRFPKSLK